MRKRQTRKRKKLSSLISRVSGHVVSPRSREMLDHSAANLKKGLASALIAKPEKRVRVGALKGRMKIKGDIIHSDMEGDWEAR